MAALLVCAIRDSLNRHVDRPRSKSAYGCEGLAELAAAYGFGLARNHALVDGNKRIAFLAMITFHGLNGVNFVVPESEAVVMMLALAAGEVDEAGLAPADSR